MPSPSGDLGPEGGVSHPPEHLLRDLDLIPSDLVNVADGRSGFAWRVRFGTHPAVLRYARTAAEQDSRLSALTAARQAGLPAPRVLADVADETGALMVLEWLPGVPLAAFLWENLAMVGECGRRFGQLQRALHRVPAPAAVWSVRPESASFEQPIPPGLASGLSTPPAGALLHLDWHPYNVLVDADGQISGVIDWDNSRSGEPGLDLARTWAILTADPALAEQPERLRAALPEFVAGWARGYDDGSGTAYDLIEDRHRRWAARRMLAEWQRRQVATPAALAPLRRIAQD